MTELEILKRRRELVVLSAELQRATVVRRLERVGHHPAHKALGFAKKAASFSLLWKVGVLVAGRMAARKSSTNPPVRRRREPSFLSRWIWVLRLLPVKHVFPVLRFLNR
ncbi:MAG TPA: hypothetical protein VH301_16525 [Usitatibacter sp.]|nr:hypothetical protein [Usitatibacter sp.]